MSDPSVIDAEARESIDEAPPVRETIDAATGEIVQYDQRPQHAGMREIGGTGLPVVPMQNELSTLAQMAVTISAAATAPKALQGKPNDAFMVLLTARDVGVALTTAIREFHVIDGKVTLSPKVKLAMVKQQKVGRVFPHQPPRPIPDPDAEGGFRWKLCDCGSDGAANGDTEATWHAERSDEPGILHSSTFTIEMAQRVKARENQRNITLAEKSTWQQYPQRMLSWRALGYLLDDVFPEVGTGLYSPDEMGAVTDEDGVPLIDVVGSADPVRGTRAPAGRRTAAAAAEVEYASKEAIAALKARIAAISTLPEARAALLSLWTATREDGSPTLPPVDQLEARQLSRAEGMVKSIEDRATKGEWGEWKPATQPEATGDAAGQPEATGDADDAQSDAGTPDPRVAAVIETVRAMKRPAIETELEARGLPKSGNMDTVRHRLATAMLAEHDDGLPAEPEFHDDNEGNEGEA
jgi:hypothetical protein